MLHGAVTEEGCEEDRHRREVRDPAQRHSRARRSKRARGRARQEVFLRARRSSE